VTDNQIGNLRESTPVLRNRTRELLYFLYKEHQGSVLRDFFATTQ